MKKIIIVGSGPVGAFIATLCTLLGFIVTVYEKREGFTRKINLKIENNLFREVHETLVRLNISSDFFMNLNELLQSQSNRILISDLENKLATYARALGALYIIKDVKSFQEIHNDHKISDSIVLDCTGRNSKLRMEEFGADEGNLITVPLQNAMYINFKAKVNGNLSLYQAIKYIKSIKLSEVVVAKQTDENGFSSVTIPVFITQELGCLFDQEFPDINRNPLNPFNTCRPVSNNLFFPVSALLGNLIVDGCSVDLNTVTVKKIEISCGYARKRSRDNFVCLGDSAVHLAFFKSLNLGLKHALELFIKFSMLRENGERLKINVLEEFKRDNPHLNPCKFYETEAENVFLVVTRVVWFGCFSYCYSNRKTERLTNHVGVTRDKIDTILQELNRKLTSWNYLLIDFESIRDQDILQEVRSNKEKSFFFDHASWLISLNGKSVIKVSEFSRAVSGKYSLYQKDFEFIMRLFEERRNVMNLFGNMEPGAEQRIKIIKRLLSHGNNKEFGEMIRICSNENLRTEERIKLLSASLDNISQRTNRLNLVVNVKVNSGIILDIVKNEIATNLQPELLIIF